MSARVCAFVIFVLLAACSSAEPSILAGAECVRDSDALPPGVWESAIVDYETSDAESPTEIGSIVFTGSSSILLWASLAEDMAPLSVLNRGFGGSVISHVTHFSDRIVLPYEPSAVVLYAGDNDIAFGASADCTLRDFEAFVGHVHAALPAIPIYFISIKASPSRLGFWTDMSRANALIEALAATSSTVHFVDVSEAMLDEQGQPIAELFGEDGLHMSQAGYELWTSIVRRRLMGDFAF